MADDLVARAEKALSDAEDLGDQMGKLASLEDSGEVGAEVADQIRNELGGKDREIRQTCERILGEVRKTLGALRAEIASKTKEREVAETKHRIGAMEEDPYREMIGALDTELQSINSAADDLGRLVDRLRVVLETSRPTAGEGRGEGSARKGTSTTPVGGKAAPPEPPERSAGETNRVCGACGTENRPGATFCKSCGSRLLPAEEVPTEAKKIQAPETPRGGRAAEKRALKKGPPKKGGSRPRRVLFLGVHSGRIIGEKVKGFDEVFDHLSRLGVEVKYEVARGRGPYTPVRASYLNKFGAVFIIGCHNDRFDPGKILQEGEVSALLGFVAGGGGLLVTPCIYGSGFNYLEVKGGLTDLCSALGVGFPVETGDLIDQSKRVRSRDDHYPGEKDDWALIEAGNHPLVEGLGKVSFGPHGGAFLKLQEAPGPAPGGVEVVLETGSEQEPPGVPVMVLSRYGEGRVVVLGSPTAFIYPEFFESSLVQNSELFDRVTDYLLE